MPDTVPRDDRVSPARGLPRPLVALAALLLYALLIDAAVETYQSTSPVRLWVALPVALYVSFSVWLLRQPRGNRPGPLASLWTSSFLFLVVLTLSASMPGGVADGLRVATVQTSTVLSVTTTCLIALALVSLTVGSPLPVAGRILAGLAAGYGMAAFVTGIAWQRSYQQLMQGGSLWQRLPYWLQGAFIGALVVLPFAFVVEGGVALARVKIKGRMHRLVAFALGALMAYAAFSATK